MPDHVHLLMTVGSDMTIEKAMPLIKGGFSHRLRKESGYLGEVWQRGFSERRVENRRAFLQQREYIAGNPGRAAKKNRAAMGRTPGEESHSSLLGGSDCGGGGHRFTPATPRGPGRLFPSL